MVVSATSLVIFSVPCLRRTCVDCNLCFIYFYFFCNTSLHNEVGYSGLGGALTHVFRLTDRFIWGVRGDTISSSFLCGGRFIHNRVGGERTPWTSGPEICNTAHAFAIRTVGTGTHVAGPHCPVPSVFARHADLPPYFKLLGVVWLIRACPNLLCVPLRGSFSMVYN